MRLNLSHQDWGQVRAIRDELLSKSDWTQMSDSPLDSKKKVEWKVYRQKLRNITTDFSNPCEVVWPIKPS